MTAEDQLHGWKDVSRFLGIEVRTAQRYEKRGLPIRRNAATRGGVYAIKSELQAWRDGRESEMSGNSRPVAEWHAMVTFAEPLPPGRYVMSILMTEHGDENDSPQSIRFEQRR